MVIDYKGANIEGSDTSKIVYQILKSFDFIEITQISGDVTDFIEITVISLISNTCNYLDNNFFNCVLTRFGTVCMEYTSV